MVKLVEQVNDMLDDIQQNLFDLAKEKRDACIEKVKTWDEFVEALGKKKMILAPWCDEEVCTCRKKVMVLLLETLFSLISRSRSLFP